jgi:hypothetical protein
MVVLTAKLTCPLSNYGTYNLDSKNFLNILFKLTTSGVYITARKVEKEVLKRQF